jgi:hypothetical protein
MTAPEGLHGAHLRADLIATIGAAAVRMAVHHGTLRPLWPRVLVDARRLLDVRTRGAAAQLSCGPRAVLTGPTAAELHGCTAMARPTTHVLLPYGRDTRQVNGLVVQHGRARDQVEEVDGLRVLAIDRVVADLLCRAGGQDALAVADQALAQRPEGARGELRSRIHRCLADRDDPRGTRRATALLDLATGRAESPAESWLHLVLVEQGVPHPEVNWAVVTTSGRELYRLDFAWPELRVCLEYDGYAAHEGREQRDAGREADLRRRGWIVVRADRADLVDPTGLVGRLRRAFRDRGVTW